jgi:hypothetical protein
VQKLIVPARARDRHHALRWAALQDILSPAAFDRAYNAFRRSRAPGGSKRYVSQFPELAAEWHPARNDGLDPASVTFGMQVRVWWKCCRHDDHEWQARVFDRVRGAGCPHCSTAGPHNSLGASCPQVAATWHPQRNRPLTAFDVLPSAHTLVWWKCPEGPDHEWRSACYVRIKHGCPYCANRSVSTTNNLATKSPGIARQWHPTRNGSLTPRDVLAGSNSRAWWRCPRGQDHEWQSRIRERTGPRAKGCPFCAGKRVAEVESLACMTPAVARMWDATRNRPLSPTAVTPSSRRKVWWRCPSVARHRWRATVESTVRASGCPACMDERTTC